VPVCLRDGRAEAQQKARHRCGALPGGLVKGRTSCGRSLRRLSAQLKKELHGFQ
jgi:hypothetical protein